MRIRADYDKSTPGWLPACFFITDGHLDYFTVMVITSDATGGLWGMC
jgi:hypothetical protein